LFSVICMKSIQQEQHTFRNVCSIRRLHQAASSPPKISHLSVSLLRLSLWCGGQSTGGPGSNPGATRFSEKSGTGPGQPHEYN
jgi:hypothetical protein